MSDTIADRIRARAAFGPPRFRVCVLLGGNAAERMVSLASGIAAAEALVARGHQVVVLDPATGTRIDRRLGDPADLPERLGLTVRPEGIVPEGKVPLEEQVARTRRIVPSLAELDPGEIDVVLSVLHGGVGEGGAVPALLELLGLPYVGSGPIASAVTLDKEHSKRVFQSVGIPVAEDFLWRPPIPGQEQVPSEARVAAIGGYPVVVKPLSEGSTVGISIVREPADWGAAWERGAPYAHPTRGLLVERFIPGREITVAVVADAVLPVVEIVPKQGFYDFEHKYTKGETDYLVPAPLAEVTARRLRDLASTAYHTLGCRDLARVDFRLTLDDEPFCLEINTLPGMTETSLVPMASRQEGIGFGELLEILCRLAMARSGEETRSAIALSDR